MIFGLDGIEICLIIVFLCLFGGILSGFPVAFAIGGSAIISFGIISLLDSAGLLIHEAVDTSSAAYAALVDSGVARIDISHFRYPDLPVIEQPVFPNGWEEALDRRVSFIVNRINERVLAGQSIETLLAVLMFVLMGITLERSRIANDLLTTMARVFGPLPGGLAVSVVVVGAFLAASTGIVGATVVTMGLLSLPTMLRNRYSPELATGVISASGTLGQIIPPSIVIVLLGTLAADIYATAQETRASAAGCSDALTYLGKAAVVSVGTLFQAAILPGIMLAALYALLAFGYALINPTKAPPVPAIGRSGEIVPLRHRLIWFLGVPACMISVLIAASFAGMVGSRDLEVQRYTEFGESAELRTKVSDKCRDSMIALHGQEKWDLSVARQAEIDASGGDSSRRELTDEELSAARDAQLMNAAPVSSGVAVGFMLMCLVLSAARGASLAADARPLWIGAAGVAGALAIDIAFISPLTSSGMLFLMLAIPLAATGYGCWHAAITLSKNELIRVVFPPLVLIIAVLGSILGGITNPTPAAALGAAGAIMLAGYRALKEEKKGGQLILIASFSVVILILAGINFDMRITLDTVGIDDWIAFLVAQAAYSTAMIGLLYALWVLFRRQVLTPVVRETAKVTSMVFTILIGSQILNLVVISFGGEHYIQDFLRSFDREWVVFLIVMVILFILGFVLDFLEIIYIVVPIVGPVIYGGTFDPAWVTIMIAVNLQTSFLTPPFGFALFYLRGVAPPEVTTGQIYRGVAPFVIIQVIGLVLLWLIPDIVTLVPGLLAG
ncbi:MAG: TRAP transporter large permease subunit [Rhodobacteraceae bacterium]|nr:TRAP transporter large permease subunit [Paracoccaceae bacterium]